MSTLKTGRLCGWLRWIATFAVGILSVLCMTGDRSVVHAMQDEHASAPQYTHESGATANNAYVGGAKCVTCHQGMATEASTPMGQAALDPLSSRAPDYSAMSYRTGPYTVRIQKQSGRLEMKASDSSTSVTAPIRWIFGQGVDGQTFILEKDGQLYESRASYYAALSNLDTTIGHASRPPPSLIAALGRPLPADEVQKCFSCHTSENVFEGRIDVGQAHPGVTCENCHGAGSEHVALMEGKGGGIKKNAGIFNPATMLPADLNDFCGRCHRTTRDVLDTGIHDIRNVRFQPYRLENSRCYDPSDSRITCIACHDPHQKLETAPMAYDQKCLACHVRLGERASHEKASACPRATKNCVSCHMPKLDLPGAHFAFTDHYIRVVHANAPYPD